MNAPDLSKYSRHYRDQDDEQVERAIASMQSRLEDHRLRLDLDCILPWVKGPDVLDFPIGTGRLYPNLIDRFNVFGYDIAPLYIQRARTLHPSLVDNFQICPIEAPRQDRKFDTAITLRTLYNIKQPWMAFRGVSSILKSGGRWIFTYVPFSETHADMSRMVSDAGMQIIHRQFYDFHAGPKNGRLVQSMYSRYLKLIEAGLVPYFAYKTVDRLFAKHGMELIVAEKV